MSIGFGERQRQRHPAPVYDEVALAAEFAPVGRVPVGLRAPRRGLARVAPPRCPKDTPSLPLFELFASFPVCFDD